MVSYAFDPAGNILKTQAGDGKEIFSETSYTYDALNRVSEITDPAGGKTAYAYDRSGHVSSITDPAGNRRNFVYNGAGELTEETDTRRNTTRYEYNVLGQLSSVTDGIGRKTRYIYLPGGRLEKTIYPDGKEMHYTYDKLGRIISKTNEQGYTLSYAYDCMGRVLSVTSSTGQKKTYTYDALGNVTSMTDANGNTTKYEYTLSGRLKTVTDALGNRAEYTYDDEDRLIHICQKGKTEEKNRETFYERNALGQVECIRDAFGNEEHYSYDALGRTIIKTDRDGYRTEYGYTSDGKIKNISYGDGTSVEMEYTALRQLALIRDWLGETKFRRDCAGNPTEITDHKGRTVAYEWGSMGERRSITYPDGNKVIYEYDEMLRLQKMQIENRVEESPYLPVTERTYGRSEEIHYKYDSMGRIAEKLFPEGMCTRWLYDEKGQLTELVHEDRYGILDRYQYEYDLMGNKTAIIKERRGLKEESGRYEYSYDGLSRLISVSKDKDALRCYEYDSFGNRSYLEDFRKGRETFYHYDTLNRLMFTEERQFENILPGKSSGLPDSAVGGIQAEGDLRTDYVYDNRGNMIREEVEGRLIHGYEYGAMNRLSRSWNDRGQEAVYLYNGLGQRTGKSVNGEEEDYLLDLTRGYHNLLDIQKEERGQRFYFDGNVTAMEETGGKTAIGRKSVGRTAFPGLHYYMQDELGSPLRVSGYRKKEGSFTGRSEYLTYWYDEFGNDLGGELEEAGIPSPYDRQRVEQPFGYTGYRYDEISGTYFAQAREYQPGNGRFTAEDVIKGNGVVPWTLNQYGYCWNEPLSYVDYDGKDPIDIVSKILQFLDNGKGDDLKDPRDELYDNLKEAVNGYANVGQILKTAPYNSTKEAMNTVIIYDNVITDAANKYDVEKEMIQSVLFQEIRFYGLDDPIADDLVKKSYVYEMEKEIYESGGKLFPPMPVIGYRTDSSTGLGQIFAKTAIEAINWYQGNTVYDYSNIKDREDMWYNLQNDLYNIEMVGMVLAYKRECIKDNNYTVKDILKAYNGSGELAEKYSDVAMLYYNAFKQYNLVQNCDN